MSQNQPETMFLLTQAEYDKLNDIRKINDLELNNYSLHNNALHNNALYRDSLDKSIVLKVELIDNNNGVWHKYKWRIKPEFAAQLPKPMNRKRDLIRVLYNIVSKRINNVRR